MFSWARLGGPLKAEGGGREIGSTGDLEVRGATEQKRGPRSDKCQDPEAASVGGQLLPQRLQVRGVPGTLISAHEQQAESSANPRQVLTHRAEG